ncbi:MAG: flagellin [Paenibacillus macerans]|uniref:Flagellin n=1 Tax=Paenibacillus macerans TaxID=44252 RepID=A0A090ZB55_PAEMA|nr:flagellin [Paenibacillus macerans]KFN07877.1 flagellin [Paenibacillus macerans]MDU7475138.1 flagellin [Paenibacillus macerans]MEC0150696.1 flagellin [Paenibacillus macerans]MEC0328180.1 flagellin [Paenibacillus macerans]OMG49047.1 flagellin [Paenibacillus macerans]
MGMFINTNVGALNANRNLNFNNTQMGKTMEKLSSGYRINRAADDAAGLAISEKMRFQINGLTQAQRNAQDGISLIQTAEGALTEVHSMLQRLNTLANQAANGTYDSTDREKIQLEVKELVGEISNIAKTVNFNGINLLNNNNKVDFQIGSDANTEISIQLASLTPADLGSAAMKLSDLSVSGADATKANQAIDAIKSAISTVSTQRATFGAVQNRLEHTVNNLGVMVENLSASESRIRDADMATEMTSFTKNQILVQAGTAMLAQANSAPQSVLKLLG